MIASIPIPRSLFIISGIVVIVVFSTKCMSDENRDKATTKTEQGAAFAGSASCASCHKSIYESHLHTAHFLTSQPAAAEYIKGSFDSGENIFVLNDRVKVVMEKRKDSFYQVAYLDGRERQANSIDIVVGSGSKGQTYLDWTGNSLFQLPVSYFTSANQWTNSPGYPGMIVFNRPISSRCLECHSTNAQSISNRKNSAEEFKKIVSCMELIAKSVMVLHPSTLSFKPIIRATQLPGISSIPVNCRGAKSWTCAPCAMVAD